MRKHSWLKFGLAFGVIGAISGGGWWATTLHASDHDESPQVKSDAAMDLTDLYVFDSGGGKTTIILCWAGFNDSRMQPDTEGLYDPGALYTVNVDNDGDNKPDIQIRWRYGNNSKGEVGVQFEGVPGADGNVSGPVESVFAAGDGAQVWSGWGEDPFFFDAQGYLDILANGTLFEDDGTTPRFHNDRDFLAGLNVTAAAIEIDTALLRNGTNSMQFWGTASRK